MTHSLDLLAAAVVCQRESENLESRPLVRFGFNRRRLMEQITRDVGRLRG